MTIQSYGEQGLLVTFDTTIAIEVNLKVHQLHAHLLSSAKDIIQKLIPAYCSLLIVHKSGDIHRLQLMDAINSWQLNGNTPAQVVNRHWQLPVCYDDIFALDQQTILNQTGIKNWAQLVALHTNVPYHVYMLGFLPGFAYLGKTVDELNCRRKKAVRSKVKAGAVGLAGRQTAIYPCSGPGGWQIIGHCPIPLVQWAAAEPFLFQAGDTVTFFAVDTLALGQWRQRVNDSGFHYKALLQ